jgi:hypothetical protein
MLRSFRSPSAGGFNMWRVALILPVPCGEIGDRAPARDRIPLKRLPGRHHQCHVATAAPADEENRGLRIAISEGGRQDLPGCINNVTPRKGRPAGLPRAGVLGQIRPPKLRKQQRPPRSSQKGSIHFIWLKRSALHVWRPTTRAAGFSPEGSHRRYGSREPSNELSENSSLKDSMAPKAGELPAQMKAFPPLFRRRNQRALRSAVSGLSAKSAKVSATHSAAILKSASPFSTLASAGNPTNPGALKVS